jgi:hypothetical protein
MRWSTSRLGALPPVDGGDEWRERVAGAIREGQIFLGYPG